MSPREEMALDMVRERAEAGLQAPSLREVGELLGMSQPGAKRLLERLVGQGLIERTPGRHRSTRPTGHVELRGVPSHQLLAELARRGETIETLSGDARPSLDPHAVTCAHDGCRLEVSRGHLFCRQHWFGLPHGLRERLLRAFGRRDHVAYQDAFTEAKLRLEGSWRDA